MNNSCFGVTPRWKIHRGVFVLGQNRTNLVEFQSKIVYFESKMAQNGGKMPRKKSKTDETVPESEKSFVDRIMSGEITDDDAALAGVELNSDNAPAQLKRRHKRKLTKKMRRRLAVARLALRGYSTAAIAETLGVTPNTVLKDMRALYDEWRREIAESVEVLKARELARIDRLEREYWDAWERSIDVESRMMEVRESDTGGRSTTKRVKRYPMGRIEFLHGVQWCIERRIEILGLKSPEKIDARHLVGVDARVTHVAETGEIEDHVLRGLVYTIRGVLPTNGDDGKN